MNHTDRRATVRYLSRHLGLPEHLIEANLGLVQATPSLDSLPPDAMHRRWFALPAVFRSARRMHRCSYFPHRTCDCQRRGICLDVA